jgi:hypothetical protein
MMIAPENAPKAVARWQALGLGQNPGRSGLLEHRPLKLVDLAKVPPDWSGQALRNGAMKNLVVLMFAFGLAQALPAAANAGSADGAGASTSGSSSADGDNSTTSTPKMNGASTSSAPQSASKSTEHREGLGDNKSDCVKTGCVESN